MKKIVIISTAFLIIITCVVLIYNDKNQNCFGCIPCEYEPFEKQVLVISIDYNRSDSSIHSVHFGESISDTNIFLNLDGFKIRDLKMTNVVKKAKGNPDFWFVIKGETITAGSCQPYLIDSLILAQ